MHKLSRLLVALFALTAVTVVATGQEAPGSIFRDCSDCPEMIVVPAGKFIRGTLNGASSEGPAKQVTIKKPFAIGKYEVTVAEWESCHGAGGCSIDPAEKGDQRQPIGHISWDHAQEFVSWLSKKTGKPYRLLTESEWEYAGRAGSTSAYPWGDEPSRDRANYGVDGENDHVGMEAAGRDEWMSSSPVGSFDPNAFGVHDMHGNVWEWVEDCFRGVYTDAPTDGSARSSSLCETHYSIEPDKPNSLFRAIRGGSYFSHPKYMRSASRKKLAQGMSDGFTGVRVARDLDR